MKDLNDSRFTNSFTNLSRLSLPFVRLAFCFFWYLDGVRRCAAHVLASLTPLRLPTPLLDTLETMKSIVHKWYFAPWITVLVLSRSVVWPCLPILTWEDMYHVDRRSTFLHLRDHSVVGLLCAISIRVSRSPTPPNLHIGATSFERWVSTLSAMSQLYPVFFACLVTLVCNTRNCWTAN